MTIHVECVNFKRDDSLETAIKEKLAKLSKNYRLLRTIDVFLYKQKKKLRSVGIACHLTRETLFINAFEEDFENALLKVIHRLKKQLERY